MMSPFSPALIVPRVTSHVETPMNATLKMRTNATKIVGNELFCAFTPAEFNGRTVQSAEVIARTTWPRRGCFALAKVGSGCVNLILLRHDEIKTVVRLHEPAPTFRVLVVTERALNGSSKKGSATSPRPIIS
jgi:hypothetical protein